MCACKAGETRPVIESWRQALSLNGRGGPCAESLIRAPNQQERLEVAAADKQEQKSYWNEFWSSVLFDRNPEILPDRLQYTVPKG